MTEPTAASPRTPRALDHAVLPTADLDTARRRLTALGFAVAPVGTHPFGTRNACVFLADGTFLEPLAIASREESEATARAGNVFTARDRAYRFRRGEDGFSAYAMASTDAAGDHAAFVEAGFSGGARLDFSRQSATPDGQVGTAAFALAFAADLRAPDAFFFTCQRVKSPAIDRAVLLRHANGVTGTAEVVLSEDNPTDFQYFLEEVVNQRDVNAHSFGMSLQAANGTVSVLTPAGMATHFGTDGGGTGGRERGLRFRAIVFRLPALGPLTARLDAEGIAWQRVLHRVVVPSAPGQGAIFAFEEPQ